MTTITTRTSQSSAPYALPSALAPERTTDMSDPYIFGPALQQRLASEKATSLPKTSEDLQENATPKEERLSFYGHRITPIAPFPTISTHYDRLLRALENLEHATGKKLITKSHAAVLKIVQHKPQLVESFFDQIMQLCPPEENLLSMRGLKKLTKDIPNMSCKTIMKEIGRACIPIVLATDDSFIDDRMYEEALEAVDLSKMDIFSYGITNLFASIQWSPHHSGQELIAQFFESYGCVKASQIAAESDDAQYRAIALHQAKALRNLLDITRPFISPSTFTQRFRAAMDSCFRLKMRNGHLTMYLNPTMKITYELLHANRLMTSEKKEAVVASLLHGYWNFYTGFKKQKSDTVYIHKSHFVAQDSSDNEIHETKSGHDEEIIASLLT